MGLPEVGDMAWNLKVEMDLYKSETREYYFAMLRTPGYLSTLVFRVGKQQLTNVFWNAGNA